MKIISVLFLFYLPFIAQAQNQFAPVGAVWHYNLFDFAGFGDQRISSEKDTVIDGIACRKLIPDSWFHSFEPIDTITYEKGSPWFVYDSAGIYYVYQDDEFRLLYDFNVAPGSYWTTSLKPKYDVCDSLGKIYVDSAGTEIIDGTLLKWICVHDEFPYGDYFIPNDRIYQKIGSTSFLFPYPACVIYEFGYYWRCYIDSELNYAYNGICDFTITGNESLYNSNSLALFPNPATDKIFLDGNRNGYKQEIAIIDFTGRQVKSIELKSNESEIPVSDLSVGVYFIRINGTVRKFVKQ